MGRRFFQAKGGGEGEVQGAACAGRGGGQA